MSENRIIELEKVADRHERDLTLIASSIKELVEQNKKTNEMIHDALLRDERFDNKLAKCELNLSNQIDKIAQAAKQSHDRLDKIETIISRLIWLLITPLILGVVAAAITFGEKV